MVRPNSSTASVAIVYHFFAHYRQPIMDELLRDSRYRFILVGDDHDPEYSGVNAWQPHTATHFLRAPAYHLGKGLLVQPRVLRLAFRRDISCIIFLGNAKHLTTWLAALLAHLSRKRVLFWTHGWLAEERGLKDSLRRAFYHLAHALLLYGNNARQLAISKGFAPHVLYVVYNSLDYHKQRQYRAVLTASRIIQIRQQLFAAPKRPLLATIGRLTQDKRIDLLLEALHLMTNQGRQINLLIIGDGPLREQLQLLAERYHLDACFYGACYEEEMIASLLGAANLTVVPGAIGLSAIHSLSYGTPVVTHDNAEDQKPEWEAIMPGYNGALYRQGDVGDLIRVITEWLDRDVDREQIRKQCFEVVDAYYNPLYQRQVIERAIAGRPP